MLGISNLSICTDDEKDGKDGKDGKDTENAYVFVMFKGDRYLPGMLVMAHSIIRTNTKYDIVCIVTDDVPESAIDQMELLGIKIHIVEYLRYKVKPSLTKKQQFRYDSWSDISLTKYHCLNLTQYKKIFYIDCDMVVIKNIDHVFDINAPAAVFENAWGVQLGKSRKKDGSQSTITPREIKNALLNKGFVHTATCELLEPSEKIFKLFKLMVESIQPFGFNSYSHVQEQAMAHLFSVYDKGPKTSWHNLGIGYAFMEWKYTALGKKLPDVEVYIKDFTGNNKPWEVCRGKWEDLDEWFEVADDLNANMKRDGIDLEVEIKEC